MIDGQKKIFYDYLYLFCGLQYDYPICVRVPEEMPINFLVVNNVFDGDTLILKANKIKSQKTCKNSVCISLLIFSFISRILYTIIYNIKYKSPHPRRSPSWRLYISFCKQSFSILSDSIIIYGYSQMAFICLNKLINLGVDPKKITFINPDNNNGSVCCSVFNDTLVK